MRVITTHELPELPVRKTGKRGERVGRKYQSCCEFRCSGGRKAAETSKSSSDRDGDAGISSDDGGFYSDNHSESDSDGDNGGLGVTNRESTVEPDTSMDATATRC